MSNFGDKSAVTRTDFDRGPSAVILLDWSGVDLNPKSTPYAKKLMELQDSNAAPDQIYTINSKSWHQVGVQVREDDLIKLIK